MRALRLLALSAYLVLAWALLTSAIERAGAWLVASGLYSTYRTEILAAVLATYFGVLLLLAWNAVAPRRGRKLELARALLLALPGLTLATELAAGMRGVRDPTGVLLVPLEVAAGASVGVVSLLLALWLRLGPVVGVEDDAQSPSAAGDAPATGDASVAGVGPPQGTEHAPPAARAVPHDEVEA